MNTRFLVSLLAATVLCSGCDTIKEELGLTRHTPDEFSVMQRAPLELPVDFNSLPTPTPGAPRPQETSAVKQAQEAVLGTEKPVSETASKSENLLLNKVGATTADASIRRQLAKDAEVESKDNRAVVKRILNLGDGVAPATVVDPAAEAKRIQDAKKAGQPITSGDTPTLEE